MNADALRVLTVRQPWAWAIVHGGKDVENRVRSLGPYRGLVAIHVAGAYAVDGLDLPALNDACDAWCESTDCDGTAHPWLSGVGRVIGVVDLVGTHHADDVAPTFCGICPAVARVARTYATTEDDAIRRQLVALGWTPPGTAVQPAPSATREEVRDEIAGHPIGSGYYATSVGVDEAREIADALLARFTITPKEDR